MKYLAILFFTFGLLSLGCSKNSSDAPNINLPSERIKISDNQLNHNELISSNSSYCGWVKNIEVVDHFAVLDLDSPQGHDTINLDLNSVKPTNEISVFDLYKLAFQSDLLICGCSETPITYLNLTIKTARISKIKRQDLMQDFEYSRKSLTCYYGPTEKP